jgi:hypothetical protein
LSLYGPVLYGRILFGTLTFTRIPPRVDIGSPA